MIRVLHIGTEKSWRGGENQIRQLIQQSSADFQHFVAYPRNSRAIQIFQKFAKICELPSSKSYDFRCPRKILEFCQENDIQILDANSSVALGWALKAKVKLPKLKLVSHRRVAFPLKQNRWSRKKHLSAAIDAYVAISEYIGKQLLLFGVDPQKLSVVRSAVGSATDLDRSACRREWLETLRLSKSAVLFGHVAAMTSEKGQDLTLKAFAVLWKRHPECHLVFAGDGKERQKLAALVSQLGVSSNVHFLGHIAEPARLLSALDVLVVPSRQEGLGTIVLDAMMAKTLVIASDVGGLPEMVVDKKTGLLFPIEDIEALKEKMHEALAVFPEGQLQAAAYKKIQADFSLDNMVNGNLQIYKNLATQVS